jgi:hypothetical protein
MNISAMKELKAYLLSEPRRYAQEGWLYGKNSYWVKEQQPPCGTAGCLAGNAALMRGYLPDFMEKGRQLITRQVVDPRNGKTSLVSAAAKKILGLNEDQATALFSQDCSGWTEKAELAYLHAQTPLERAQAAAMQLDSMIRAERQKRQVRQRKGKE